jgi:5-methylcytosine-specific restriction protein A
MPNKPRSHANPESKVRSLKARVDSKRYGSSWRKLRDEFLALSPVCHCNAFRYWDDALGVYGVKDALEGARIAPATVVDHIRPLSMGGTHEWGNLQALCNSCHTIKTRRWG